MNIIDPHEYEERARQLFEKGYNCSQSVAGAFCGLVDMDEKFLLRLASSFGGGMGRMREVCGCVSGMLMVLGLLYGYDDPSEYEGKKELYRMVQELSEKFRSENGSIYCKVLLGLEGDDDSYVPCRRTAEYYQKRPCAELAAYAAGILAQYIIEHPIDE